MSIPPGHQLIADTEIQNLHQHCLTLAYEQVKIGHARLLAGKDAFIEKLQQEKTDLEALVQHQAKEIDRLNASVKGLEEEVSETSANLKDVITTNDGLNQQVCKLENDIKVQREACKCGAGSKSIVPVKTAWQKPQVISTPTPDIAIYNTQTPYSIRSVAHTQTDVPDPKATGCSHLLNEVALDGIRKRFSASKELVCHGKRNPSDQCSPTIYVCLKCGTVRCDYHVAAHCRRHKNRHAIFIKMDNMTVWCSVCQCDIPHNFLTEEIRQCQKVLEGKGLFPTKKSSGIYGISSDVTMRKELHEKNPSKSNSFSRKNSHAHQMSSSQSYNVVSTSSTDTTPIHSTTALVTFSPQYLVNNYTKYHSSSAATTSTTSNATTTTTKHLPSNDDMENHSTHNNGSSSTTTILHDKEHSATFTNSSVVTSNHTVSLANDFCVTDTMVPTASAYRASMWSNSSNTPVARSEVTGVNVDVNKRDQTSLKKLSVDLGGISKILPDQHRRGTPSSVSTTSNTTTASYSQQTVTQSLHTETHRRYSPKPARKANTNHTTGLNDKLHCASSLKNVNDVSPDSRVGTSPTLQSDNKHLPPSDIIKYTSNDVYNQPKGTTPPYCSAGTTGTVNVRDTNSDKHQRDDIHKVPRAGTKPALQPGIIEHQPKGDTSVSCGSRDKDSDKQPGNNIPKIPNRPPSPDLSRMSRDYPVKGLRNTELNCYLNATLQCLSRIKPFWHLLKHLLPQGKSLPLKFGNEEEIVITISQSHGEVSTLLNNIIDDMLFAKSNESRSFLDSKSSELRSFLDSKSSGSWSYLYPKSHLTQTYINPKSHLTQTYINPKSSWSQSFLDPLKLLRAVQQRYTASFQRFRQCDSHEIMRCILDAVRMEEIKRVKNGVTCYFFGNDVSTTSVDNHIVANGETTLMHKAALCSAHKFKTYIDEVVGGELLSVVVCLECKNRAELIEPFLDISVPIPENYSAAKSNMQECLKAYTDWDILDNENKFICTKCSNQGGDKIELKRAKKQLKIRSLPSVLILHLKRFHIGVTVTKNSTFVEYPEQLDISKYCTESTGAKRTLTHYSLFAVVEHIGSLSYGHYTAYLKVSDRWYKADDSIVTVASPYEVLNREAYLLFYQQEKFI